MTETRNVLALNVGSSTLRYRLLDLRLEASLDGGTVEGLGAPGDHESAARTLLERLASVRIDAVGHRVVHGGDQPGPRLVDDDLEAGIDDLSRLAPLHNPPALAVLRTVRVLLADVPQVAVFDTSFHSSLPDHARTYAIDAALARRHGIRRYGFHGISFAHVAREAARALATDPACLRMVVLHLGNGASAAAIHGGRSIDTSMGFTPVEGLVMGTRSGDLDPSIVTHLQAAAGLTADEATDLLNHRSGLLGLCGTSDMRDVLRAARLGSEAAELAIEVYVHRLRRYIGAYAAELGGIDALVFTGGVGENSAEIRERAVERLGFLGIRIDPSIRTPAGGVRIVSPPGAPVAVLVVPTDEELEIARQTAAIVGVRDGGGT